MNRLDEEIILLEKYLEELSNIIPNSFNDYQENFEKKAACERYFEKIVESIISISYLFCRNAEYLLDDKAVSLDVLYENSIINKDLLQKLKDAKGMRNIIAHQYGDINDLIVFESITKELIQDSKQFLEKIIKFHN